jgi:hypothetical protein
VDGADFSFNFSSDGDHIFARPFFNVLNEDEDAEVLTYPDLREGFINVSATSEFHGGEVYIQENLAMNSCQRFDWLYGYRYFSLEEDLEIRDQVVRPNGEDLIPAGTRIDSRDLFQTENTFNGGEIGWAWQRKLPYWTMDGHFKLGLGAMRQRATISGQTSVLIPDPFSQNNTEGGLLALPSNIGEYEQDRFAVIPELSIGGYYCWTPHWKISLHYDFLYVSSVMRPGELIDLSINDSQIGGGTLSGAARPDFRFRDTDFWAQGISFGLEYRR